MRNIFISLCIFSTLICVATSAWARSAGAINQMFNTSARFEGMGSAGVGAPWGTDTNHWANPAMLAFRPGVNYLRCKSKLAAGLADNIYITNDELTLGAYGVTLLWAKSPMGGNYLDMGEHVDADEIGTYTSYMESKSWGLGLDAVTLAETLLGRDDRFLSRYVSIAGGYVWSDFECRLAPDDATQNGNGDSGSGKSTDKGLVIRVTPLDLTRSGLGQNSPLGIRASAAYGWSLLNDSDEFIEYVDTDQSDPFRRTYMQGWSGHVQLTWSDHFRQQATESGSRLLLDMIDPLLSFTYSRQTSKPGYVWKDNAFVYECNDNEIFWEKGSGWELGIANVLYVRRGHVEVEFGGVDGASSGWGINLQAGRLGGFRFDKATVPQATELPTVTRNGWSVWADPFEIARHFQK